jgi:hypothetical protein
MNISRTKMVPELRDALYELSLAKEVPDADTLEEVSRRYPQYGAELTEFAIALNLDALISESDAEAAESHVDPRQVSPEVSRAISHFHNRLHAGRRPISAVAEPRKAYGRVDNPLAKLSREEIRGFAGAIGANNAFVQKLRDRNIRPDTFSHGFTELAARELSVPADLLVAHYHGPRGTQVAQHFKAEDKPSEGVQQSFEEAVRSSGLTDEQQRHLLSL